MKKRFPLSVVPMYAWLLFFCAIPLLYVLIISFCRRSAIGGIEYVFTLENYIRLFDPIYLQMFLLSIVLAAAATLLTLLIGYPFAYFTAKKPVYIKTIVLFLIIIPFWTSGLVRTSGFIILLRTEGVINHLLQSLHLIEQPLELLYNNGAVMVGMAYTLLPFMILPLYNSIEKLDYHVLEASRDLGAGKIYTFFHVTLPLTMPGIVAGCMLVFIPSIGLFFISDLLGGAKVMLLGNLIQNQFGTVRNWPFGAALSILMMLCSMVFILIYTKVSHGKDIDLF